MIRLLLGNAPDAFLQIVVELTDIELVTTAKNESAVLEGVRAFKPDVALLNFPGENGIWLAQKIAEELPEVATVLVGSESSAEVLKQALRAGVKDYLDESITPADMLAAIRAVHERSENQLRKTKSTILMDRLHHKSKVIAFVSAKGGVGKTTTAVNVGVALAKAGKKVVVVDMDFAFGDVNVRLGLPDSPRNIYSLMLEGERYSEVFSGYLTKHETGLYVLSAPLSVEEGEYVTAPYVQGLIRTLRADFDYILIDTAPVMNDVFLVVFESADQVLMLSVADLASVKNNRRMLAILQTLGYDFDNIKHVSVKKGTLGDRPAMDVLESDFYATIAFDGLAVGAAANLGIPVVVYNKHSKASRDFSRLTEKLLAEENRVTSARLVSKFMSLRKKVRRRG